LLLLRRFAAAEEARKPAVADEAVSEEHDSRRKKRHQHPNQNGKGGALAAFLVLFLLVLLQRHFRRHALDIGQLFVVLGKKGLFFALLLFLFGRGKLLVLRALFALCALFFFARRLAALSALPVHIVEKAGNVDLVAGL